MNIEGKRRLFALIDKVGKMCSREAACEGDKANVLAAFGLLFRLGSEEGFPPVRMTDVSRYLMISKPAATQAVNRLVDRGLLERVNDESDRRVVYIHPTEEGNQLFREELERRLGFIDRVVQRMGVQNAEQLADLLDCFFSAAAAEMEEK